MSFLVHEVRASLTNFLEVRYRVEASIRSKGMALKVSVVGTVGSRLRYAILICYLSLGSDPRPPSMQAGGIYEPTAHLDSEISNRLFMLRFSCSGKTEQLFILR